MKSKQDIQLELLAEIDDICSKNGLKYILIGQTALNAYLNHTVKNGTRMMSVAMTMGDMDRFCEIIENEYSDDRYVEGMFNNPKFNPSFINYGNKNTTYFNMVYLDNNIHNGIEVRIYPIRKHAELDDLKFARKFIEWNDIKYGIQRVDACRTKTGKLLLVELEDLNPFLSLQVQVLKLKRDF